MKKKRSVFARPSAIWGVYIGLTIVVGIILGLIGAPHTPEDSPITYWPSETLLGYCKLGLYGYVIFSAGLLFHLAFTYLKHARTIQNVPTSKVRSASQGYCELLGKQYTHPDFELKTPYNQQACTWYHFTLERHVNRGKNSRWETVCEHITSAPILLKDETGESHVDAEYAEMIGLRKASRTLRWRKVSIVIDGQEKTYHRGTYRVRERYFSPGDPIYVIGNFNTVKYTPQRVQGKETVGGLLKRWKDDYKNLLKNYDTNQDGEIDVQEWEAVVEKAESEINDKYGAKDEKPRLVNLMSCVGVMHNRPYIISRLPQSRIIIYYKLKAFAVLLFFLAFLGGVYRSLLCLANMRLIFSKLQPRIQVPIIFVTAYFSRLFVFNFFNIYIHLLSIWFKLNQR